MKLFEGKRKWLIWSPVRHIPADEKLIEAGIALDEWEYKEKRRKRKLS